MTPNPPTQTGTGAINDLTDDEPLPLAEIAEKEAKKKGEDQSVQKKKDRLERREKREQISLLAQAKDPPRTATTRTPTQPVTSPACQSPERSRASQPGKPSHTPAPEPEPTPPPRAPTELETQSALYDSQNAAKAAKDRAEALAKVKTRTTRTSTSKGLCSPLAAIIE